jgi:two-component system, chemotaxis family, chemotaxis protein CheY
MMIKKILLVDDSPISRKILKSCIPKDRDYEIAEAGDGMAGLESYKQFSPDVTFMDLTMPVMDGTEATEEILKFDPNAVIIVCTADVQVKSLSRVMELGAFMVVRKPPSKETVAEALDKVEAHLG